MSIDVEEVKREAVKAHDDDIVKLNQSQLRSGMTFDDKNIKPRYSDIYLKRKKKLSSYIAPTGTPDLFVTGQFYKEMETIVRDNEYMIVNWDEKMKWLGVRYDNIFGLSKENIDKIRPKVTATFVNLFKKRLS
jgi:hypothetical protein